jgi:hypothetical protein
VGAIVVILLPGTGAQAPATAAGDTPATTLRVLLGRLLAEHSFLLMESIRAASLEADDADALDDALDANSGELRDAIASVYGDPAGDRFATLWQEHIDLLVDHAVARRDGRTEEAESALTSLGTFRHEFAAFLAEANPAIDGHGEADAVQLHLDQVIAFSDGDYVKAYEAEREAFSHMFSFGDHLARAIGLQFPERFKGATVAWSPASNLRLALDRLLAEHLVLSAQAMRAGLADGPDASAARGALEENSAELSAAIGTYYGASAASAFQELWSQHVNAYLAYIDAYSASDEAARASALATLHGYHDRIAAFLSDANPHLSRRAVSDLISRHVQALITQVEATAEGDHVRAVATIRGAYAHMFDVGDALSAAIAAQFPEKFKEVKALPPTDSAVAAPRAGLAGQWWSAAAAAAIVVMLAMAAVVDRRHPGRAARPRR